MSGRSNRRRMPCRDPVIALCTALLLGGCAATQQTRSLTPSGFLGDYTQLEAAGRLVDRAAALPAHRAAGGESHG